MGQITVDRAEAGVAHAGRAASSEEAPAGAPLRLLVCEDSEGDFARLRQHLGSIESLRFEIEWTKTLDESITALHRMAHDAALVDHALIGGSGLDVLREAVAIGWPAPVIMLTGLGDPSIDLQAMKLGASDFLDKDDLRPAILARSLRYNMERKRFEAVAAETNRELLQYIGQLRDAKHEIELQNQRIVSLAYHLSAASHGEGQTERSGHSVAPPRAPGESARLGVWNFDADGRTLLADEMVLDLLELSDPAALAQRPLDVLLADDSRQRLGSALAGLDAQAAITLEVELAGQASGRRSWVVLSVLPGVDAAGERIYLATVVDITGRRNVEDATRYLARHDSLTGLANRACFEERLDYAAAIARRSDSLLGLLCVDLDSFKQVNDTLGHRAGDSLLRQVGERLSGATRKSDTVARLGGDEFGVIATNLKRYDDAATMAGKISAVFERPFEIRDQAVSCGASVGVAVFPTDGDDLEELFERADAALYRTKRSRARAV